MTEDKNTPYTISQFIDLLNDQLKPIEVKIIGEITTIKISSKGHVYFTLKDKDVDAVLDCVLWKGRYELNGIELEAGMEIMASGYPNVYPNSGKLSFIAEVVERVGEGALMEAYKKLKLKLSKEGLFAPDRKRALPVLPHTIGVITSKQGAVIDDFLNNVGRHGFSILFIDSRVEGQEALIDLSQAIHTMQKQKIDVLVIMRGGGSLQSLAAFDNETIVREIAAFPVPVIAAIGHHKDVTLSALAADVHVSTPTAAATMLHELWQQPKERVTEYAARILNSYQEAIQQSKDMVSGYKEAITSQFAEIFSQYKDFEHMVRDHVISKYYHTLINIRLFLHRESVDRIFRSYDHAIKSSSQSLDSCQKIILLNDPLRPLGKGYSLTFAHNKLVKSVHDIVIGDTMQVRVSDGSIDSSVQAIKEK
jgi:exodeoxyribonuclease VII large subunit